jgi:hypothetical protein
LDRHPHPDTTLLWPTHVLGGCGPERSGTRRTALDH